MKRLSKMVMVSLLAMTISLAVTSPAHADRVRDDQWHVSFLRMATAHQMSQGEGIKVAVLDTGVEANHPDLTGNILPGVDVIGAGSSNGWGDTDGHGTGMAGLIVAHGHGTGGRDGALGIAPKAKVIPVRVALKGNSGDDEAFAKGIDEGVRLGAKIISTSFYTGSRPELDAVKRATAANVIVVTAAGNRPRDRFINSLCLFPGVVCVGAIGPNGTIADLSVRGPEVDVLAPGTDIVSAGKTNPSTGSQYRKSNGTSDSTALVAGLAALIWAKYPSLTDEQVVEQITATATDKGPPGKDNDYGSGVVDPVKALTAPIPTASVTPPSPIQTLGPSTSGPAPEKKSNTGLFIGIGLGLLALLSIIGVVLVVVAKRVRPD